MKFSRRNKATPLEFRPFKGVGEDESWTVDTTMVAAQPMAKLLQHLHLQERLQHEKILKLWPQLVGEFNVQHSFPESLKKKVLVVRVSNSPYLHQLTMIKPDLLKKIQKVCGQEMVTDIRLSV